MESQAPRYYHVTTLCAYLIELRGHTVQSEGGDRNDEWHKVQAQSSLIGENYRQIIGKIYAVPELLSYSKVNGAGIVRAIHQHREAASTPLYVSIEKLEVRKRTPDNQA